MIVDRFFVSLYRVTFFVTPCRFTVHLPLTDDGCGHGSILVMVDAGVAG